jgi:hypothetical protein
VQVKIPVAFHGGQFKLIRIGRQLSLTATKGKRMNELTQALVEVEREAQVRQHVYPRLVATGKLTQDEADRRMRAIRYAIYYLEQAGTRAENSTPPTTG